MDRGVESLSVLVALRKSFNVLARVSLNLKRYEGGVELRSRCLSHLVVGSSDAHVIID